MLNPAWPVKQWMVLHSAHWQQIYERMVTSYNQNFPIDVIKTGSPWDSGYTAMDTRRTVSGMAAQQPIYANVHQPSDKLTPEQSSRLYGAPTWGAALRERMRRGSFSDSQVNDRLKQSGPLGYIPSEVRVPKMPNNMDEPFRKAGFQMGNDPRAQHPKFGNHFAILFYATYHLCELLD